VQPRLHRRARGRGVRAGEALRLEGDPGGAAEVRPHRAGRLHRNTASRAARAQSAMVRVLWEKPSTTGGSMTHVTYKVVRHDDGWAYTVDGVSSEPFPTHAAALAAARRVAAEQRIPGRSEAIEWEDEKGRWHSETARGTDRPETDVQDTDG